MHANRGGHIALMSWPEIAAQAAAGAVAMLPVGAACKEHGLHLPMASDWLQAEWLAARICEQRPVLAWPTLGYGHYPAFVAYAGSVSIGKRTFIAGMIDILGGVAAAGVAQCIVLNTGISTIAPLRSAIAEAGRDHATRFHLHNVGDGECYRRTRRGLERQRRGGHADEIETSVMLVVAPHLVRLDRAQPADAVEFAPGPLQHLDASAGNHSVTGAYGDPTLATAAKGRDLLAAMVVDLVEAVDRCLVPDIEP